ncbi:ABC transporter ATP-binding protein [Roseivirga pacifica]|uniref:ABC transporter ATP-binding protein n=1 Tax=Roseivirga pacifica TaxID=1267423 RepID=UPI0020959BA8|nr:ATP-binding cassette domain-containing protein [Roseivirga pacifica]MCO6358773.1 ATP-binding cassette domain-containing protein [Roseivirga pacifica]MCO6365591.1 ATP-binding cassette domain-containing protein [Roseivirga pacifica]MCO6371679.1 ATP-binding cassette domain-containing protein [Roseivirga pacifica]MCO6376210.1 ATP-binding cassette domain-containing protein [Roseivirga pacifica]MCO6379057.1 ATP-binding cassette domain-containing protein [Roseivirga pacifica]
MEKPIIETFGLGKKYRISSSDVKNGTEKSKNWINSVFPFYGKQDSWALRNIDLRVQKGDVVAVMGNNGSGKSTLFKLLSEVTDPSEGSFVLRGTISSMLEVGVGFHLELTGKENIFLNGTLLGMKKTEINKHFDEIVAFSGVEHYLNVPIKKYSSGMYVRLAFAVASFLRTDILLVDEVLSVGDKSFKEKSIARMKEMVSEGTTIMIVSHDTSVLRDLCNRAVYFQNGRMMGEGQVKDFLV